VRSKFRSNCFSSFPCRWRATNLPLLSNSSLKCFLNSRNAMARSFLSCSHCVSSSFAFLAASFLRCTHSFAFLAMSFLFSFAIFSAYTLLNLIFSSLICSGVFLSFEYQSAPFSRRLELESSISFFATLVPARRNR
jgi:hypothetical protein